MASRLVKNVIEVNMISGPSSRRGDIPDGTVTYQGMGGSEHPADTAICRDCVTGPPSQAWACAAALWLPTAIAPPERKVRYALGCA